MDNPLVTIGIPTYNRADGLLKEALDSALNQTYKNIEIIVSDNCSIDHTEELVQSYHDSRIKYYKQPINIGPFRNMNFCLEKAQGVYFLMLYDDDLIDNNFIETCLRYANHKDDNGIIIAGAREINNQGEIITEMENTCNGLSAGEFILQWYQSNVLLFLCSILFNTKKLKEIGGYEVEYRYFADLAAEFKMICMFNRIDVPDILASFRVNPVSFGKKGKISQWCDDSIKILELACKMVDNEHLVSQIKNIGMETSARRMYRDAMNNLHSTADRLIAYFIIFKKFKYYHLPPKKYLYQFIPWLSYFLSPIRTAKKIKQKIYSR
jgi:glycosyltransferase involved in cell wall biosynthesis